MKSKNKILSLLFVVMIAFSCKKQDLPAKPQPSTFGVTVENPAIIPSAGSKVLVDIKAGSDGWWLTIPTASGTWCSASQVFGSGDKTITLTFKANTTGAGRSVSVIFNPTFDLPAQTITFQQN